MLNQIVLIGRLTKDPEIRRTQTGTAVASFTIAVDRDFTSGSDKKTDFIDIVAWRNTAEFVSKYFTKGQMIAVAGSLQVRDWTDKDGNKRKNAEVVASNVYFADSKKSGGNAPTKPTGDKLDAFTDKIGGTDFDVIEDDDGELPF